MNFFRNVTNYIWLLLLVMFFCYPARPAHAASLLYDSFDSSLINSSIWDKVDSGTAFNVSATPGTLQVTGASVWNDPALYSHTSFARSGGLAFVNYLQSNLTVPTSVYHFSPSQFPGSPTTTGYGIYMEAYQFYSVVPGALVPYKIYSGPGYLRSHNFETVTVLRPTGGSYHLISGGLYGTFPTATLLWVNDSGTDANLYAGMNFNTGNGAVHESKVVQLSGNYATQYGLANAADTFTRADSTTLGTDEVNGKSWSEESGDWEIQSGKIANTAGGSAIAVIDNAGSQGIYEADVNTPSSLEDFGIVFRYNDTNNYLVAYYDSATPAIALYKRVSGSTTLITQAGLSLSPDTTYRLRVIDHGGSVCVYIDNSLELGGCVAVSENVGNTGAGVQVIGSNTTFDTIAFWPRTVTLPTAETGGFLTTPTNGPTSLASDTFSGVDDTTLSSHTMNTGSGWTMPQGGWNLESNTASPSAVGSIAVTDVGTTEVAASADITLTAGYGVDTEWYSGIIVRYVYLNNYTYARFLWQSGSPEIELWEVVNGTPNFINAVQLGTLLTKNSTHSQKVAVVGNQVAVYFDDELVLQGKTVNTTGTKVGMQIYNDIGSVTAPLSTFDNFLATDVLSDSVAPPSVADLTTSDANPTTAPIMSWTPVIDDAVGTSFYRIYRSILGGSLGSQINTNGVTTTGSYTDSSLSSAGTYYYTARAVDVNGNESTSADNNQLTINYNTGTINNNNNNNSNNSGNSSSSSNASSVCSDAKPSSAPNLFQANATPTTITLYFAPSSGEVNNYYISYGYTPGDQRFGIGLNQGKSSGAVFYTLNSLSPNTTYYFRVRGGNGCMPGDWGNELKATTAKKGSTRIVSYYKNLLSHITSILPRQNTSLSESAYTANNSCEYIVQQGDSLFKIAKNKVGNGNLYETIRQKNVSAYPTLKKSTIIRAGWRLSIPC